ncbi:MAG: dephospho-CoA kinase [Anaerovoracaceae bacterium]
MELLGMGLSKMKVIGLTGGIGTGKSVASSYLEKKGYKVIDADKVAREVVKDGSPLLKVLVDTFGPKIIKGDGSLDRKALGELAFSSAEKNKRLNQIMHKAIIDVIREKIKYYEKEDPNQVVFLDAALLFETGLERDCNQIWLLCVDLETRLGRICQRDGLSKNQVMARINSQMPQKEKEAKSDLLIDNSATPEMLYKQLDKLI